MSPSWVGEARVLGPWFCRYIRRRLDWKWGGWALICCSEQCQIVDRRLHLLYYNHGSILLFSHCWVLGFLWVVVLYWTVLCNYFLWLCVLFSYALDSVFHRSFKFQQSPVYSWNFAVANNLCRIQGYASILSCFPLESLCFGVSHLCVGSILSDFFVVVQGVHPVSRATCFAH